MASKNIFSDGYTQLPEASTPDSISALGALAEAPWSTGHADAAADPVVKRGMFEMTRFSPSAPWLCGGVGEAEVAGAVGLEAPEEDHGRYDVSVCVQDLDGGETCDVWSTGHAALGDWAFAASAARAWASHASRVLWSTGQAAGSDLSAMGFVRTS